MPADVEAVFYLATADTTWSSDPVARIDIKQLHNDTASYPNIYTSRDLYPQDFSAPFSTGAPVFDTFSIGLELHGKDFGWESHHLRVYWYGDIDFYARKIEVAAIDSLGLLWSLQDTTLSDSLCSYYSSLSYANKISDWYAIDEIWGGSFQSYKRAQDILNLAEAASGVDVQMSTSHYMSNRQAAQANPSANDTLKWAGMALRFQPERLPLQVYPYSCYTDSASDVTVDSTGLQRAFDRVRWRLAFTREKIEDANLPFAPLIQTGAWTYYEGEGEYREPMREITATEQRCLANFVMCFGAEEIGYWQYSSGPCPTGDTLDFPMPGGIDVDVAAVDYCDQCPCWYGWRPHYNTALVNFDTTAGGDCLHTTYRTAKWYAARDFNMWADSLADLFLDFDWVASVDSDSLPQTSGVWLDSIQSLTYDPQGKPPYVEAAFYTLDGDEYFMLLNRRCLSTEAQDVRAWIDGSSDLYHITDMYSYDKTLTGSLSSGEIPFMTSLEPGEAKLFKIESAGYSSVSGSTSGYPSVWSGKIPVSGDLTVASGHPLTIHSPAELRVSAGSDYTVDVYDDLTATGTAGDSVVFMSAAGSPDAGDWYGIRHYGGDLSLSNASIKHAYKAIWLDNTTDTLSATIHSCNIENHTVSGITIKANPASTVTVANSSFHDAGLYGVQVYEGFVTIDSCTFSGNMRDGIRIQGAWQEDKIVGGLIRGNIFEDMTYSYAKGVYLYGIEDDGRDYATEPLMQDNLYMVETTDHPGQVAYVIYDCSDTINVLRNAVGESLDSYSIGYGIMTYTTQALINGDVDSTESKSRIFNARYGVYVYSSSGVSEHPIIREMSLWCGTSQTGYPYSVWVSRYGLADLGTSGDYGTNVIHGRCGARAVDTLYSVYNLNSDSTVMAVGNYWSWGVCTYGPVDASERIFSYPFAAKVAITTMLGNSESAAARTDLAVLQAYPNPFNASATIRFSLSTSQKVDVTIYNILGQRVRNLWSDTKEAGEHFLEWDGRDGSGQVLASGVYLYRVTTETKQIAKSIVLVK